MKQKIKTFFALWLISSSLAFSDSRHTLERLLVPFEPHVTKATKPASPERIMPVAASPSPKTVQITREKAIAVLLAAGKAAVHKDDSLEITIRSGFQPVVIPEGVEWSLFTPDPFAPDNRGRWVPALILTVNGEIKQRWRLVCDVDLYRMVFMVTQRLGRGETPMSPGIAPVIVNIFKESSNPIPAYENISDYEMVRNLSEGRFLTWDDIIPRRAVRNGEMVDVTLINGQLQITMRAICLQDGSVNDVIRLRNPRTRAEFAGIVTAPGTVMVTN
jgi:flagella basal body P-ring formation protein FlgA